MFTVGLKMITRTGFLFGIHFQIAQDISTQGFLAGILLL